jgi:hypothetical protein
MVYIYARGTGANSHDKTTRDTVKSLPDRLLRIIEAPVNLCREEFDLGYLIGWSEVLRECVDIKPFVRRTLQGAIVQVESVDVRPDIQRESPLASHIKQNRPKAALQPTSKHKRVMGLLYSLNVEKVKGVSNYRTTASRNFLTSR